MKRWALLGVLLLLPACTKKEHAGQEGHKKISIWQTEAITRDTLDVMIPIEGKLVAWQRVKLAAPQDGKIISLLVRPGDRIKAAELLLHLWPLQRGDYTPIELKAPLTGLVARVFVALNDTVRKGDLLLTLENRENLLLRAKLNPWQMDLLQLNADVRLRLGANWIHGVVSDIERSSAWIRVIVPNTPPLVDRDLLVSGQVLLKKVAGNFLPAVYFNNCDSLPVSLEGDLELTLYRVGQVGDSLVCFWPSLPGVQEVQIKKNLDFND